MTTTPTPKGFAKSGEPAPITRTEGEALAFKVLALTQQRDELVTALEQIHRHVNTCNADADLISRIAGAALAKVTPPSNVSHPAVGSPYSGRRISEA